MKKFRKFSEREHETYSIYIKEEKRFWEELSPEEKSTDYYSLEEVIALEKNGFNDLNRPILWMTSLISGIMIRSS